MNRSSHLILKSCIYSVFNLLSQDYTQERILYLQKHHRISEYDSENLMYVTIKDVLKRYPQLALNVVCHHPLHMLIRNTDRMTAEECHYALNPATHLDFLIYSQISKEPVLAIEVDGFHYHKQGTKQYNRDQMKNHILELYEIPFMRFPTNGSGEKERLDTFFNNLSTNKFN